MTDQHPVTIETSPTRLLAHLRAEYCKDLVRRMRSRAYRFSGDPQGGYWAVPLLQVEDLAGELMGAGYAVVVQAEQP